MLPPKPNSKIKLLYIPLNYSNFCLGLAFLFLIGYWEHSLYLICSSTILNKHLPTIVLYIINHHRIFLLLDYNELFRYPKNKRRREIANEIVARGRILGGISSCSWLLLLVVHVDRRRNRGGAGRDYRERDGRMQRHVRRRRSLVGSHRRHVWIFICWRNFLHESLTLVLY